MHGGMQMAVQGGGRARERGGDASASLHTIILLYS